MLFCEFEAFSSNLITQDPVNRTQLSSTAYIHIHIDLIGC